MLDADDVKVSPIGIKTNGSLTDGTFVIDQVDANTIGDEIPDEVTSLPNLATNDGKEPVIDPECDTDCGATVDPDVNPNTTIEKSVVDSNGDAIAENDEDLTYTIALTNKNDDISSYNIPIRDSMLDNVTWDGTVEVNGSTYAGSLSKGEFNVAEVKPNETVTIVYTVHVTEAAGSTEIENIATDNGDDSSKATCGNVKNCSDANLPTDNGDVTEVSTTNDDDADEGYKSMAVTGAKSVMIMTLLTVIAAIMKVLKRRLSLGEN